MPILATDQSMESSNAESHDHVIQIWEVKEYGLEFMQRKLSATRQRLQTKKSARHNSSSIFRASQSQIDANGRAAYQPQVVSIGPYHHGDPRLRPMEDHKWTYLSALLDRTGLGLEDYFKTLQPLETKARDCYSESIHLNPDEFVEVLVLDGCFLIELFRRIGRPVPVDPHDQLLSMQSLMYSLFADLIRMENQIPFFILQELFEFSKMPGEESDPSLTRLALECLNNELQRPDVLTERCSNLEGKHLLDIVRSSLLPPDPKPKVKYRCQRLIKCVSKLRLSGIRFRPGWAMDSTDSFLEVKFRDGVVVMPTVTMDDFMTCLLANCVAFEQFFRNSSSHFTTYAMFLDCLINTSKDVEFLGDCNVLDNYMGSDEDVAKFVNGLGKDVAFDIDQCYLRDVFEAVNEYCVDGWNCYRTSVRDTYFSGPWSVYSLIFAIALFFMSLTQAIYAVLAYHRPPP